MDDNKVRQKIARNHKLTAEDIGLKVAENHKIAYWADLIEKTKAGIKAMENNYELLPSQIEVQKGSLQLYEYKLKSEKEALG